MARPTGGTCWTPKCSRRLRYLSWNRRSNYDVRQIPQLVCRSWVCDNWRNRPLALKSVPLSTGGAMRRIVVAAVMFLFAVPAFTADEFPLTLRVLGLSERASEMKRLWRDPCIQVGMGAPCKDYEELPPPGWAIEVLTVTGRLTQRGRTLEYELA